MALNTVELMLKSVMSLSAMYLRTHGTLSQKSPLDKPGELQTYSCCKLSTLKTTVGNVAMLLLVRFLPAGHRRQHALAQRTMDGGVELALTRLRRRRTGWSTSAQCWTQRRLLSSGSRTYLCPTRHVVSCGDPEQQLQDRDVQVLDVVKVFEEVVPKLDHVAVPQRAGGVDVHATSVSAARTLEAGDTYMFTVVDGKNVDAVCVMEDMSMFSRCL
jgi:hypothetical protein